MKRLWRKTEFERKHGGLQQRNMIQKLATISTRHSFKSGVNEAEDAEQAGQEKL